MVDKNFLEQLYAIEIKRLESYRLARKYYAGESDFKLPPKIESDLINRYPYLKANCCDVVVNTMASRLKPTNVRCENKQKAKILQDIWSKNQMDLKSIKNHRQSIKIGDSFVLVWPDTLAKTISVNVIDSSTCFPYYIDDDGTMLWFKRQWIGFLNDGRACAFKFIYYPDRIERFYHPTKYAATKTLDLFSVNTNINWLPYDLDSSPSVINHPFGIPFIHFPNRPEISPWGDSELTNMYGLQNAVNVAIHVLCKATEFLSTKQGVIAGATPADFKQDTKGRPIIDMNAGDFLVFGSDQTKAYSLDQSNPDGILRSLDGLFNTIALTTRTPRTAFDSTQSGNASSGYALAKLEAPLIAKCSEAQVYIGAAYEKLFSIITHQLKIMGISVTDDSAYVEWLPLSDDSPTDELSKAQKNQTYIDAKVLSRKSIQRDLGYTQDEIVKIEKEILEEQEQLMNIALGGINHFNELDNAQKIKDNSK